MNRRAIRLIFLRSVRATPGRKALAVVAVGAGVALVVGVVIANSSLSRSLSSFSTGITGPAALRVEGTVDHGGLDASNLAAVAAVDGVQAAVPMIVAITEVVDSHGDVTFVPVLGVDCAIEAILVDHGCTTELLDQVDGRFAVGPGLATRLGPRGKVRTDLGELPVARAVTVDPLAELNGGLVAVFDLATAQLEFVRPNGLDLILVVPEPGTDLAALQRAVQHAVGDHNLVVSDPSNPFGAPVVSELILPIMLLISLMGLLIGAQLARNAIELSLEERRRELATAAALGAGPRDVMFGVLAEATAIGLLGGLVGLGLGTIVAAAVVDSVSDQLAHTTGLHVAIAVTPLAVVVGVVVAVMVCVATAIGPARRASRRDLAAEISERSRFEAPRRNTPARLMLAGAGFGVSALSCWAAHRGGALERWQPPVLVGGVMLALLVGFQVPGLLIGPVLEHLRGRRWCRTGATRIALDNLLAMPKRTSTLAGAVAAPMLMAVVLSSIAPGIGTGAGRLAEQGSSGRVYASTVASHNANSIDAKVSPAIRTRIAELPQVARVDQWQVAVVNDPHLGRFELDGIEGRIPDYHVHLGEHGPAAIAAGRVMVGPRLARDLGVRPGDDLRIAGRYGWVTLRIGGVWSSPAGLGRSVTTSTEVTRSITGPRPPNRLQLVPATGVTPHELVEDVRTAGIDPRLIALDPEELGADYREEFTSIASPFWTMQRGVLAVALVATASTLLLAGIQRRRETALLTALGMAPRALAGTTLMETLFLGVIATAIAGASAQVPLLCFTWASEVTTGLVIPYQPQLGGFVTAALSATLVALVGAALPAWRSGRIDPATALREE